MDLVAELWSRVTLVAQPLPLPWLLAAVAVGLAAVLVPGAWHTVRHAVTVVHEGGHGLAAVLTGRRLSGIRLHSDTSGLTVSRGPRTGPGMVLTLLAGYTAPAIASLGAAWLLSAGYAAGLLWALLLLLALMLVQIRNWFGLWVVLVGAAIVVAVTFFASPPWQSAFGVALTAVLGFGALRTSLELQRSRRRSRTTGSDADQLAALTRVPGVVWVGVFVIVALVCLAGSAGLIFPQTIELARSLG
ncbi:M50 family metallopeptidase [Frigoribacterium sp. CFBP9030]|uniref:M50 family metallopeptidase n=1 Tax=Frigoribacterium sp. CFBP9030 TaxID=3096537 RepID=UPI002A6A7F3F|nr:M50 family metallopeptidase [Frigoribacterium sp. CFBP9030]MDY0890716.1 M50 family metallopeptidase [Frigoribacterium sp. CFBP9030]